VAAKRVRLGHVLVAALCCACVVSSAAAGAPQTVGLHLRNATFSPNGDHRNDTLQGELVLKKPAAVWIDVLSPAGKTIAELLTGVALPVGSVKVRWNGTSAAGATVPDGDYTLAARAVTRPAHATAEAKAHVVVSTRAPGIYWPFAFVAVLTPKRPRLPLVIGRDAAPVRASLSVADQAGTPVALLQTPWTSRRPAAPTKGWGAKLLALEPGMYHIRARAVDRAGNASSSAFRSVLVKRRVASHVLQRFRNVGRRVALTFDDCNSASAWRRILTTLRRDQVVAAFFCPGVVVAEHRALALRALHDHHVIGDHSWSHPHVDRLSPPELRSQFARDQSLWWTLAHASPQPYFRPPYGAHGARVLAAAAGAGYGLTVLWDVDPDDWTKPGAKVIAQRVLRDVRPGSIVVMHVLPQTAAALPAILHGLRRRGLAPTGLNRLAQLDGLEPRIGLRP
jgi:peptidoglycan/xylan/chitin deacetylase (PgdA/CDA1 family)